ncbi:MAG: SRPBCC family protein [bacterium]
MTALMKSQTLNISIECDPRKVYDFVSNLANLPKWATTFCQGIRKMDGEWVAQTPQGAVTIRMAARNDFGVLDHTVIPAPGVEVFVPMRVVPNATGSEVIFTLFRQPNMADADFTRDQEMVRRDLNSLKSALES